MSGTKDRDAAKAGGKEARAERLAAALRENLKRRKAQSRGRAAGSVEAPDRPGGTGETRG